MQLLTIASLLLFGSTVTVFAFDTSTANDVDVAVLTEANFDSFIAQDIALVEFYAPWCGHCKVLAPEYAKAATALKTNDPAIPFGKVDASSETKLASRFSISGYPTLKVFRNGRATDYNGPRQADGIANYMKKQARPAVQSLPAETEFKSFIKSDKLTHFAVVGFFDADKVSQLQSSFLLVAQRSRDYFIFGRMTISNNTAAGSLLNKYTNLTDEAIIAFSYSQSLVYDASQGTKTSRIESWLTENALPLVSLYNEDLTQLYNKRSPNVPILKVFMKVDGSELSSKTMKYTVNRLNKLAADYDPLKELLVVIVDKYKYKNAADQYAITTDEHYALVIEHFTTDNQLKKWKYMAATDEEAQSKKMNVESWKQWVQDVLNGNEAQYIKSERPPATNDGPVKIVTGQTFDTIVNDASKDVMIEFYAPWCGHCKALEPKYNQLGEKIAKKSKGDNVVIAKIDATANDFDRSKWNVAGFPTLYFRKASKDGSLTTPMKYEGVREVDEIFAFIKKNSLHLKTKKKSKKDKKESRQSEKPHEEL